MSTVTTTEYRGGKVLDRHKETLLSGSSIITSSRFSYVPTGRQDPISGKLELRVAYTQTLTNDDEEIDSDQSNSQLLVSLVEKLEHAEKAFVDVYFFNGHNLRDHGFTSIPKGPDGEWCTYNLKDFISGTDYQGDNITEGLSLEFNYDSDDSKLDRFGGLISEMLKRGNVPRVLQSNPVVRGLKDNEYYKTRSQAQLPLECLRILRHEEIPIIGVLFQNQYPGWVFPPDFHPDSRSRDLYLQIAHTNLEDLDIDPVLSDQLPLKIELTEKFNGETYVDSYLFVNGRQATHSWTSDNSQGTKGGNDRTFLKLKDYGEPISVMVKPKMCRGLETHPVIRRLREKKIFER